MKTPKKYTQWIGLAAGLILISQSPLTLAGESTGGGNGTGSRQEQLRKLRSGIGPKLHIGPKLTSAHQPQIDEWCDRITRFLMTQRKRATNQIQDGQRTLAIQTMRDAMNVAEESIQFDGRKHSPITYRLLRRGQEMAATLDQLFETLGDEDGRGMQTEALFLMSYLGFVIETTRELDRPLYVPYLFDTSLAMQALEGRYLQYATEQLSYVNGNFSRNIKRDGEFFGLPVGESKVYLMLAGMISSYVAEDLEGTLSAYANSCAIGDLREVSQNIGDYLFHGDKSVLRNDAYGVDSIRTELARISGLIAATKCGK